VGDDRFDRGGARMAGRTAENVVTTADRRQFEQKGTKAAKGATL
jgi:hypothetical protein